MADDTDGVEEALAGQVRVAITAAGMVGEALARAQEQRQRLAQAGREQKARELASRLEAERRAARAEFGVVHRPEWWNNATPEQIGRAYQNARAWSHEEPEAVRAELRISQELQGRFGIDAAHVGADPIAVRAALAQAQQDSAHGAGGGIGVATDQAEAQVLLALADQQDRRADEARATVIHERGLSTAGVAERKSSVDVTRGSGGTLYDSAERREQTARGLKARGVSEAAAAARMSADVSQARPAADAVKSPVVTRAAGRRTRAHGPQIQHTPVER